MMATFDYIPDQIYVPVGVLDDVDRFQPEIHCHAQSRAEWLHINDGLPRENASARSVLNTAGEA